VALAPDTPRQSLGQWLLDSVLGKSGATSFTAAEVKRAVERGFAPWLSQAAENGSLKLNEGGYRVVALAARAATLRAENLRERLADIVHHADGRGVPVCLLKGAVLEPWLYPGPGFRPMADIDVLVKPTLQPRFEALLAEQGYVQRSNFPPEAFTHHHHSMPFWHPEQGIWIEVHTRLYPEAANVLLEEVEPFDYRGTIVNRLRASAQIVYTVAHWAGRFTASQGFVGLLDLAFLLRQSGLPDLDHYDFDAPQRAWMRRALSTACSLLPPSAIPVNLVPPAGLERWRQLRLSSLCKCYVLDDEPFTRWRSPGFANARWRALMDTSSNLGALLREPWWCLFPPEEGRFNPRTLYARVSRLWRRDICRHLA